MDIRYTNRMDIFVIVIDDKFKRFSIIPNLVLSPETIRCAYETGSTIVYNRNELFEYITRLLSNGYAPYLQFLRQFMKKVSRPQ